MREIFKVGDHVRFQPEGDDARIYGRVIAVAMDDSNSLTMEYAIVTSVNEVYWISADEVYAR